MARAGGSLGSKRSEGWGRKWPFITDSFFHPALKSIGGLFFFFFKPAMKRGGSQYGSFRNVEQALHRVFAGPLATVTGWRVAATGRQAAAPFSSHIETAVGWIVSLEPGRLLL